MGIKIGNQTYIIERPEIEKAFKIEDYISTIENVFKLYGKENDEKNLQMPPKQYLTFEDGDVRAMLAYVKSMNSAGIKYVNSHPKNKNLPTVMATIILTNPRNGCPLAIMDGTYITKMRTGAAGAVAAKYLSREDSKVAAFVGAGEQAKIQLDALLKVRPNIKEARVYDINKSSMNEFVNYTKNRLSTKPSNSIEDAVKNADIITTTTPVKEPIVKAEYISKGTHINAIGADAKEKQELDPRILKKAKIVVDNWEQASHSGEINVPLSKKIISKKHIYADIGEIVAGTKSGRKSSKEITLFDSTGLAIQDIPVAYNIYKKIVSDIDTLTRLVLANFT